ncbi:hypothetical protein PC116_g29652 [Phytophthora cactorum]|nr:hypothetical protein PC116_g29652 [Phytophthora cactorum]
MEVWERDLESPEKGGPDPHIMMEKRPSLLLTKAIQTCRDV